MQNRSHADFRCCVSATDTRHVPTAVLWSKTVHRSCQNGQHALCNSICDQRRDSVTDLMVLCRARAFKKVVVRKCLCPSRLPDGEASALCRIVMNVVVAVLRDVGSDGRGGPVRKLNAKPIREH